MTLTKKVYQEVSNNPGITLPEITKRFKGQYSYHAVAQTAYRMVKKGEVLQKGLRGHYEYYPNKSTIVEKSAVNEHSVTPHLAPISLFSPRELLEELKRRGYVWDKMWVEERKYVEYEKI